MAQNTQNKSKTEKMTVEDLAVEMARGFLAVDKKIDNLDEKFVTNERFDKSMAAIADSFNQMHESITSIQKTMEIILDELGIATRNSNLKNHPQG